MEKIGNEESAADWGGPRKFQCQDMQNTSGITN